MTNSFLHTLLTDAGWTVVEVGYFYDYDPGTYDTPPAEELLVESVADIATGLPVVVDAEDWPTITEAAWKHAGEHEPEPINEYD